MKKLLFCLLFALPLAATDNPYLRYSDTDSLAVTTVAVDTTFSNRWENVTLFANGCDILVKMAMFPSDSTSWATRPYNLILDGTSLEIVPNNDLYISGLERLKYKASSGSGALFISGTRKGSE